MEIKHMRSLLALFCILFSIPSFANKLIDSVGVENINGAQVVLHKVAPKESYYSIARLYNVSPKDIIAYNNNVSLQIGTLLKVPTKRPLASESKPAKAPEVVEKPAKNSKAKENKTETPPKNIAPAKAEVPEKVAETIEYKVGPKETLYAIAKKFNTSIGELKKLNNLPGYSLSIGQVIKVPGVATPAATVVNPPVAESKKVTEPAIATTTTEEPAESTAVEKPKIASGRLGLAERSEHGVAVWIADENLDGTKMLALHRTAPIGTIVKVTNPMTNRTTFAKVVGKFTENETTKDVIIVLTKATADMLGALDKRFQVSIDYGVPNE